MDLTEFHIVGPDLLKGHQVQPYIPGGTFHTARVIGKRRWFLGASTEWPGVEPADVELGNADALVAKYPKVAAEIRTFPAAGEVTTLPPRRRPHPDREGASAAPLPP